MEQALSLAGEAAQTSELDRRAGLSLKQLASTYHNMGALVGRLADQDAERAIFLYREALKFDPDRPLTQAVTRTRALRRRVCAATLTSDRASFLKWFGT